MQWPQLNHMFKMGWVEISSIRTLIAIQINVTVAVVGIQTLSMLRQKVINKFKHAKLS